MQRSLYHQALRMHGQDLSLLVEKQLQGDLIFVENEADEHRVTEQDGKTAELDQRESTEDLPESAPAAVNSCGEKLTGTMRDLLRIPPHMSIDSSTEESSKSDTSPEILPLGVPRELHEPFDESSGKPWNKKTSKYDIDKSDGFGAKLQEFISKKANLLYKAKAAKEPTPSPSIQDTEDQDYYAILPPLEQFMDVPPEQTRKRLFEILQVGDIIGGSIIAIKDFGMFVRVTCLIGQAVRYIHECDIVGLLPKGELGDRYSQKAQLEDFRVQDLVRCKVVKTDAVNEKVILTMKNETDTDQEFPLGIVSEGQMPVHYRRSVTQAETGESYDEMLDNTLGFDNSYNVAYLANYLQIDDTDPPSLLASLQASNFPVEEHAESLRKWQSHKWAMESVARGVEHFKASRHLEAMQQLNRALEIDQENVEGLVARGALFANQDSLSKAIKDFAEALRIKPTHKNANRYMCQTLYEKGKQCEESGEKQKAMDCYQSAADLNPDYLEACQALQRLMKPSKKKKSIRVESEIEISSSSESPPEQMSAKQLRDMIDEEDDDLSAKKKKKKKDKHQKDMRGDKSSKKEKKLAKKKKKKIRRDSVSSEESRQRRKVESSDSESGSSVPRSPVSKDVKKKPSRVDDLKETSPEVSRPVGRKRSRNGDVSPVRRSRSKTRKADLVQKKTSRSSSLSSSNDERSTREVKETKNRRGTRERSESGKAKRKADKKRSREVSRSLSQSSYEEEEVKPQKNKKESKKLVEEVSHKKRKLKEKEKERERSSSLSNDSADSLSQSPIRKKSKQVKQSKKKVKKLSKRPKKRSESVTSESLSGSDSEKKASLRKAHKKKKKSKKKQKKQDRSPSSSPSDSAQHKKAGKESAKKKHKKKKDVKQYSSPSTSEGGSSPTAPSASKSKQSVQRTRYNSSPEVSGRSARRSRSLSTGKSNKVLEEHLKGNDLDRTGGKKRARSSDYTKASEKDMSPQKTAKERMSLSPTKHSKHRSPDVSDSDSSSSSSEGAPKEKNALKGHNSSKSKSEGKWRRSESPSPARHVESSRSKKMDKLHNESAGRKSLKSSRTSESQSPVRSPKGKKKSLKGDELSGRERKRKRSGSLKSFSKSPEKKGEEHEELDECDDVKGRQRSESRKKSKDRRESSHKSVKGSDSEDFEIVQNDEKLQDSKKYDKRATPSPTAGVKKHNSLSPDARTVKKRSPSPDSKKGRRKSRDDKEKKDSRSRRSTSADLSEKKERPKSVSQDRDRDDQQQTDKKVRDKSRSQSKDDDRRKSGSIETDDTRDVHRSSERDERKYSGDRRKSNEEEGRKSHDREKKDLSKDMRVKSHERDQSKSRDRDRSRSTDGERPRSRDGERPKSRDGERPKSRDGERPRSRDGERPRSRDGERPKSRDGERLNSREGEKAGDKERNSRKEERGKEARSQSTEEKSRETYKKERRESTDNSRDRVERYRRSSERERSTSGSIADSSKKEKKTDGYSKQSEKHGDKQDRSNGEEKPKDLQHDKKGMGVLDIQSIPMPPEKEVKEEAKKEPSPILYVTSGSCKDEIIKVKSKWDTDSEDEDGGAAGSGFGRRSGSGMQPRGSQRSLGASSKRGGGNVGGGSGQRSGGYYRPADTPCDRMTCHPARAQEESVGQVALLLSGNEMVSQEPLRLRGGCVTSPPRYEEDGDSDSDVSFSSSGAFDSDAHEDLTGSHGSKQREWTHKSRGLSGSQKSRERSNKRYKAPSRSSSASSSHSQSSVSSRRSSGSSRSPSGEYRSDSLKPSSRSSSASRSSRRSSRSDSGSSRSQSSRQSSQSRHSSESPKASVEPDAKEGSPHSDTDTQSSGSAEPDAYMLWDSWEDYMDSRGHTLGKEVSSELQHRKVESWSPIGHKESNEPSVEEDFESEQTQEAEERVFKQERHPRQSKEMPQRDDHKRDEMHTSSKRDRAEIATVSKPVHVQDTGPGSSSHDTKVVSIATSSPLKRHHEGPRDLESYRIPKRGQDKYPRNEESSDSHTPNVRNYGDQETNEYSRNLGSYRIPTNLGSYRIPKKQSRTEERNDSRTPNVTNYRDRETHEDSRSRGSYRIPQGGQEKYSRTEHRGDNRIPHINYRDRGDYGGRYSSFRDESYSRGESSREHYYDPRRPYRGGLGYHHQHTPYQDDRHRQAYQPRDRGGRRGGGRRGDGRTERRGNQIFWKRDKDWGRGVTEAKESNIFFGLVTKSKETLIGQLYDVCSEVAGHLRQAHRLWWL